MGESYILDRADARAYPEFRDGTELCAKEDPEIFFTTGSDADPALKVCRGCTLRDACLEWALETDQRFGVWGATTAKGRQLIKNRRGRK